jgi:pantetheine-phosphate adenylyltransferase
MYLVRGLRNDEDFSYEEKMAKINRYLASEIETIYLRADNDIIASSTVRGFFKEGEDVSPLVPLPIKKLMLSYNI